jgi:hypothetical protein
MAWHLSLGVWPPLRTELLLVGPRRAKLDVSFMRVPEAVVRTLPTGRVKPAT